MDSRGSDPPAYNDGFSVQQGDSSLTPEQMQWLLKRLSSEDQAKLTEQLKSCTSEMTLTRGLPFAVGVMGAMYYARHKLPQKFHFGPKGPWFYAIIGFTSLTAANFLSMSTCSQRIRPMLNDLWLQYSDEKTASGTTYEMLRQRNRANLGSPAPVQLAVGQESSAAASDATSADYPSMLKPAPSPRFPYGEEGIMSGTPTSSPSQAQQQDSKTNQYGDVGFS